MWMRAINGGPISECRWYIGRTTIAWRRDAIYGSKVIGQSVAMGAPPRHTPSCPSDTSSHAGTTASWGTSASNWES